MLQWARGVMDLLAPRECAACELPLEPEEQGLCEGCAGLLDQAQEPGAAYVYGGPLADAIRRLKYEARTEIAPVLAALLAGAAARHAGEVDVVVPVPLHPGRLRERGFNQAALLSGPAAGELGVPLSTTRLARVRATPAQAGLDAAGRADNVRGAFRARPDARAPRVLLVDDVRTTGATLRAAEQALRAAGATEVHPLALAAVE